VLNLKLTFLNIEGLTKAKLLSDEMQELFSESDIIALGETWCREEGNATFDVEGFARFETVKPRRSSRGRFSGGILVYVRSRIAHATSRTLQDLEDAVVLELDRDGTRVGLVFAYIPPVGSNYAKEEWSDELEEVILSFRSRGFEDILLMGDWNCRVGELDDRPDPIVEDNEADEISELMDGGLSQLNLRARSNLDKTVNQRGPQLLELLQNTSLCILNGRTRGDETGEFTYLSSQGNSSIDLAISSPSLFPSIDNFQVRPVCIESGHFPIQTTIELVESLIEDDETQAGGEGGPSTLFSRFT
jgi:exonuclease III